MPKGTVTVTMEPETKKKIDKLAKKENKTRSAHMEQGLKEFINLKSKNIPESEWTLLKFYGKLMDLVYENREIHLMEKSPLSLLGPNLTSDGKPVPYEVKFSSNLNAHLKNCQFFEDHSFFEVFNKESLENELSKLVKREDYLAKQRIDKYYSNLEEIESLVKESEGKIELWPAKRMPIFYRAIGNNVPINPRCLEWIYVSQEENGERLIFGEGNPEAYEAYLQYITDLALKEPYQGDPVRVIEELKELPTKLEKQ